MTKSAKEKLQKQFLKELYKQRGCMELSSLVNNFYGMNEEQLLDDIIKDLVEQKACVVEKISESKEENHELIFITTYGLAGIKKAEDMSNWTVGNLTYERRCHGYSSVSEYCKNEKRKMQDYDNATSIVSRMAAEMFILAEDFINPKYSKVDKRGYLLNLSHFLKEKCQQYELSAEIHITVVEAILDYLIKNLDTESFQKDVYEAKQLLDKILNQRLRTKMEYRIYKL